MLIPKDENPRDHTVDTDPGVDDVLAILLALASPEFEILAIVISFGESEHVNILKMYQAIARHLEQFPEDAARFPNFQQGRKTILAAQYFHGRDGLAGITERHSDLDVSSPSPSEHPQLQITSQPGVEVALELIKSEPSRCITYIALGPLTNLAKLMRLDRRSTVDRLGRVVCMGGALDVPGNTSPMAEFNFFADPYAVHELLCPGGTISGFPLDRFVLLPLDITTPHELSFPLYARYPSRAEDKPPIVHFASSFLERTREVMCEFGKDALELHDIVAVWCALVNPPVPTPDGHGELQSGWKATRRKFAVERYGELTRGMLVVDRRDDPGAYAPGANRAEVQAALDPSHRAGTSTLLESNAVPAQVEIELAQAPAANPAAPTPSTVARTGPVVVKPAPASPHGPPDGVACVTETPGSDALVRLLLSRVFGVELPAAF
ncbi:nucleoside hydrolase [Epithele typhae]|uniref:nucleoside hydrolase n=1 Tax=Epithele typhae TaxID=378194 RepID=UPI0020076FA9|nr:nucleoside hydrolase [Epithele typhae]KAH9931079.1 nucleoside hydrolase [Epithele typhae]